jgi:Helix-turn-helix domain
LVEHRNADVRQVAGHAASGDDAARFLHELRQLRDGAGLGHAELAARAHYPYDSIRAAEVGPSLPELPVLAAYVRGCGGTTEEWEERWRSLTRSPALPVPAARPAGRSAAAAAGARIGSAELDADTPDPAVIIAALNRVAEEVASTSSQLPEPTSDQSWSSSVPAEASPAVSAPAFAAEPVTDGGLAGWDPIRVSSAWPAIPASAGPNDLGDSSSSTAAPWEVAPWAQGPAPKPANGAGVTGRKAAASRRAAAAASGTGVQAARGTAVNGGGVTAAGRAGGANRTAGAGATSSGGTSSAHGASRARLVVVAVILLCVLAVVLAIFI